MKVLVLTTNLRFNDNNKITKEIERMHREASEYGIMYLPDGFSGKVIEFDAVREETIDLGPLSLRKE